MTKQEFRQTVLANAIADIGKGEEGENNWGPYVASLLSGVGIDYPAAWCAAEVVKDLNKALLNLPASRALDGIQDKVGRIFSSSAKKMFNVARKLGWVLPVGELPQPGDIGITAREAYDAEGNLIDWLAHAFVVEMVDIVGAENHVVLTTIEGNVGAFPAKVRRFYPVIDNKTNSLWYSETRINELHGWIRLLGFDE